MKTARAEVAGTICLPYQRNENFVGYARGPLATTASFQSPDVAPRVAVTVAEKTVAITSLPVR
jgi:hypothetical protein